GAAGVPAEDARDARWVTPPLGGGVTFADWAEGSDSAAGERRVRHSVWRGWRPDKAAAGGEADVPGGAWALGTLFGPTRHDGELPDRRQPDERLTPTCERSPTAGSAARTSSSSRRCRTRTSGRTPSSCACGPPR